jgi:hypothetical protein
VRVFSVFEMDKHKQHVFGFDFLFREYNSMHVNVRVTNYIKKLLENGKLITFMNICKEIFEFEYLEQGSDFYPVVFYLFILKRTINPTMCYDSCDFKQISIRFYNKFGIIKIL